MTVGLFVAIAAACPLKEKKGKEGKKEEKRNLTDDSPRRNRDECASKMRPGSGSVRST